MRASFSAAYPAIVLLASTLLLGPWKLLRARANPVSSDLRRDLGIWAGIMSIVHAAAGQCVHLRGRPWLYYVYSHQDRHHALQTFPLRHDIFGLANWTGAFATLLLIPLMATSNDWALRRMGARGWKGLQRWNYALFALVAFHGFAYQLGVENRHADFVLTTVLCVAVMSGMQLAGFIAHRRRDVPRRRTLA